MVKDGEGWMSIGTPLPTLGRPDGPRQPAGTRDGEIWREMVKDGEGWMSISTPLPHPGTAATCRHPAVSRGNLQHAPPHRAVNRGNLQAPGMARDGEGWREMVKDGEGMDEHQHAPPHPGASGWTAANLQAPGMARDGEGW
jgi:hypothetical protein